MQFRSSEQQNTRGRILEAAEKLMIANGVRNTTLAQIAEEAGISKGTLFYHYASKNDLICDVAQCHIDCVTDELLEWIRRGMQGSEKLDPASILAVAMDRIMHSQTRTKLHLYLLQDAAASDPALKAKFQEQYGKWRTVILEVLQDVYGKDSPYLEEFSYVILAVLDGLSIRVAVGADDIPTREIAQWLSDSK